MNYKLFDIHSVLFRIRQKFEKSVTEIYDNEIQYIDNIPPEYSVEDLPFYRDYLSKFSLSRDFCCRKLMYSNSIDDLSDKDFSLLFKLVCGSFSTVYKLEYNKDVDALELSILASSKGVAVSRKFQNISANQIDKLFVSYLEEQIKLEVLHNGGDINARKIVDEGRMKRLVGFEYKLFQIMRNQ